MDEKKGLKVWESILATAVLVFLVELSGFVILLPRLFSKEVAYSAWNFPIMVLLARVIVFSCVCIFLYRVDVLPLKRNQGIGFNLNLNVCFLPIILGVLFAFSQSIFYDIISEREVVENANNWKVELLDLPIFVASILLVPLTEELFFRAFLMKRLSTNYGEKMGLVLSAVLFGLFHLPDLEQVMITLLGGIIAGYIYLRRDLIIQAILFHMSWNFIINLT